MSNTRSLPDPNKPKYKHVFDLDALEQANKPREFVARLDGQDYTFADPYQDDWQTQTALDPTDLRGSLKRLLGEQYEAFEAVPMPMWKMRALNDAIDKHYRKYYGDAGEDNA